VNPEEAEDEVERRLEEFDYEAFQKQYSEVIGRAEHLNLSEDALSLIGGIISQLDRCDMHVETQKQVLINALDTIKVQRDGFNSEYGSSDESTLTAVIEFEVDSPEDFVKQWRANRLPDQEWYLLDGAFYQIPAERVAENIVDESSTEKGDIHR